MGLPIARITDIHICPVVSGIIPHVGGPLLQVSVVTVLMGGLPAAQVSGMLSCIGAVDTIIVGSTTVLVGAIPVARFSDKCAHGGTLITCFPTILIG